MISAHVLRIAIFQIQDVKGSDKQFLKTILRRCFQFLELLTRQTIILSDDIAKYPGGSIAKMSRSLLLLKQMAVCNRTSRRGMSN